MALYFPSWLEPFEWLIGADWPHGNEDLMWQMGRELQQVAGDIRELIPDLDGIISGLANAYPDGSGGEKILEWIQPLRDGDGSAEAHGSLRQFADNYQALADSADSMGDQLEAAKLNFYIAGGWLVAEVAWALASGPASPFATAAVFASARVAFRAISNAFIRRISEIIVRMIGRRMSAVAAKRVGDLIGHMTFEVMQEALIETFQGTTQELAVQAYQNAKGHIDGYDWNAVGLNAAISAVAGGAGGLVGFGAGRHIDTSMGGWRGAFNGALVSGLAGTGGAAAAYGATGLLTGNWDFDPRSITGGAFSGALPGGIYGYRGTGEFTGPGGGPVQTVPPVDGSLAPPVPGDPATVPAGDSGTDPGAGQPRASDPTATGTPGERSPGQTPTTGDRGTDPATGDRGTPAADRSPTAEAPGQTDPASGTRTADGAAPGATTPAAAAAPGAESAGGPTPQSTQPAGSVGDVPSAQADAGPTTEATPSPDADTATDGGSPPAADTRRESDTGDEAPGHQTADSATPTPRDTAADTPTGEVRDSTGTPGQGERAGVTDRNPLDTRAGVSTAATAGTLGAATAGGTALPNGALPGAGIPAATVAPGAGAPTPGPGTAPVGGTSSSGTATPPGTSTSTSTPTQPGTSTSAGTSTQSGTSTQPGTSTSPGTATPSGTPTPAGTSAATGTANQSTAPGDGAPSATVAQPQPTPTADGRPPASPGTAPGASIAPTHASPATVDGHLSAAPSAATHAVPATVDSHAPGTPGTAPTADGRVDAAPGATSAPAAGAPTGSITETSPAAPASAGAARAGIVDGSVAPPVVAVQARSTGVDVPAADRGGDAGLVVPVGPVVPVPESNPRMPWSDRPGDQRGTAGPVGDFRGDARPADLPGLDQGQLLAEIGNNLLLITPGSIAWNRDGGYFVLPDGREIHVRVAPTEDGAVAEFGPLDGRPEAGYEVRMSPTARTADIPRAVAHELAEIALSLEPAIDIDPATETPATLTTHLGGRFAELRVLLAHIDRATFDPARTAELPALRRDLADLAAHLGLTDPARAAQAHELLSRYDPVLAGRFDLEQDSPFAHRPAIGPDTADFGDLADYRTLLEQRLGDESLARMETLATQGRIREELVRRVFDPVFTGKQAAAARKTVPAKQLFAALDPINAALNDTTLTEVQRAAAVHAAIDNLRAALPDAFRETLGEDGFRRMHEAADDLGTQPRRFATELNHADATVTLDGETMPFADLLREVDRANRAATALGVNVEYTVVVHDRVDGRAAVEILPRPRPQHRLPLEQNVFGEHNERIAHRPRPAAPAAATGAHTIDVGVGRSAFAVEMTPAPDRAGEGLIIKTELASEFPVAAQRRRDRGILDPGPLTEPGTVMVFGDMLFDGHVLAEDGAGRIGRIYINNVSAHFDDDVYDALARSMIDGLAPGARIELQWDMKPEKSEADGGYPGDRGHIDGDRLWEALERLFADSELPFRIDERTEFPGAGNDDYDYTINAGGSNVLDAGKMAKFTPPRPDHRMVIVYEPTGPAATTPTSTTPAATTPAEGTPAPGDGGIGDGTDDTAVPVPGDDEPTPEQIEELYGIPIENQQKLQRYVDRYGLRMFVRPTNPDSVPHLKRGAVPKPMAIKDKTINDLDIELGAPPEAKGLVGRFAPGMLRMPDTAGMTPEHIAALEKRLQDRTADFDAYETSMREFERQGTFRTTEQGIVEAAVDGEFRPITGDHDLFDLRHADGTRLTPAELREHERNLAILRAGVQHGPHVYWDPPSAYQRERNFEKIIDSHQPDPDPDTDNEPLVVFGALRPPRVEWADLSVEGVDRTMTSWHVADALSRLPGDTGDMVNRVTELTADPGFDIATYRSWLDADDELAGELRPGTPEHEVALIRRSAETLSTPEDVRRAVADALAAHRDVPVFRSPEEQHDIAAKSGATPVESTTPAADSDDTAADDTAIPDATTDPARAALIEELTNDPDFDPDDYRAWQGYGQRLALAADIDHRPRGLMAVVVDGAVRLLAPGTPAHLRALLEQIPAAPTDRAELAARVEHAFLPKDLPAARNPDHAVEVARWELGAYPPHDHTVAPIDPGPKAIADLSNHPDGVTRNSDGLIIRIGGRPIGEVVDAIARDRAEKFTAARATPAGESNAAGRSRVARWQEKGIYANFKSHGKVSAVVMDLRTGVVYEGFNGSGADTLAADDTHPTIEHNITEMRRRGHVLENGGYPALDRAGNPESPALTRPYPHFDNPYGHAEVKAANEALWARDEHGLDASPAAMAEFYSQTYSLVPPKDENGDPLPLEPKPYCANCHHTMGRATNHSGRYHSFPHLPAHLVDGYVPEPHRVSDTPEPPNDEPGRTEHEQEGQ
ncbi:hypothetical protein CJ469_02707 [Nocardia farcinica]|uniref:WXG100-like domain-containing protein n=1 Tax=Nocardia farcinica TaxID=37329 RepID=UPI000BF49175|nr:hypothetical protein [Nocardia farcinica]PFX02261.1 hypothetical protein CJ469_02707 [Nocardia farcinica]PFX09074.1 hypothetical protein CJ468_01708 [Nocardia farcinica]